MTGGITRCRMPAMIDAGTAPLTKAAFRALVDRAPEACPHDDCSPGGCRANVREVALIVWKGRKRKARRFK